MSLSLTVSPIPPPHKAAAVKPQTHIKSQLSVKTPVSTQPQALKQAETPPVQPTAPVETPAPAPTPTVDECSQRVSTGDYYEDLVINRESGGQPCIYNSIGACGLFQSLPCGKMGCDLTDIQCQLGWGYSYMAANYGSWANAWAHEVNAGWW